MTHNRDELKEKIAKAIDFGEHCLSLAAAEDVLSAIEQSGCTICPNDPTMEHYWKAGELHFSQTGADILPLDEVATRFWRFMLSSSPFKRSDS